MSRRSQHKLDMDECLRVANLPLTVLLSDETGEDLYVITSNMDPEFWFGGHSNELLAIRHASKLTRLEMRRRHLAWEYRRMSEFL